MRRSVIRPICEWFKVFWKSKMERVIIDGQPYLCLFPVKDILPGEEILYSYGVEGLPWHETINYVGMAS